MLDCCKPVPSNQAQIFSPSACDFASYFTEQIEVIWTELPHPSTSCCLPNKPSLLHLNISLLFPICFFSSCLREKKKRNSLVLIMPPVLLIDSHLLPLKLLYPSCSFTVSIVLSHWVLSIYIKTWKDNPN